MSTVDPNSASDTPDPSVARAERRLRLLEELSEIGMALARGLKDRAAQETPAPNLAGQGPPG